MGTNMSLAERQLISLPSPVFHPLYNFEDGDVILQSSDGLSFKVHKLVLRIASEYFDKWFDDLPQQMHPESSDIDKESPVYDPISLREHSDIIRIALGIIYPNRVADPIESLETALLVSEMAEKYQIKKVIETTCASLLNKRKSYGALENFLIACKYGTNGDMKTASSATLDVNLYDASSEKILSRLDDRKYLQLLLLHIKRRQMLLDALKINSSSISNPDEKCMVVRLCYRLSLNSIALTYHTQECVAEFNHPYWSAFKYCISSEMDKCSSGATIVAQEFWGRHQLRGLWSLSCKQCEQPLIDKEGLTYEIKRILELLPNTI